MVNLLCGYSDANIYGYPRDSDIIRLVLLAIYFIFINTSSAKYNGLSIIIILISTLLVSIKITLTMQFISQSCLK